MLIRTIPTPTVPDNGLINGKNNFDCSKAPPGSNCVDNAGLAKFEFVQNKKYRLRIINTRYSNLHHRIMQFKKN